MKRNAFTHSLLLTAAALLAGAVPRKKGGERQPQRSGVRVETVHLETFPVTYDTWVRCALPTRAHWGRRSAALYVK